MTDSPKRYVSPFLFGILELPFGAAVGFLQIAVPYWLEHASMSIAAIGALSATAFMPHAWKVLWVPLIDFGAHRKRWYLASVFATAALLASLALLPDPAHHLAILTAVLTLAQATAATASAALEALMATSTRPEDKGRAAGWFAAGNVGGTGLLGGAAIWLGSHVSPQASGLILGGIVLACGLLGLRLVEHRGAAATATGGLARAAWLHVKTIARDLWITIRSREGLTGLVICAVPVGCGALTNLFSAMSGAYGAPEYYVTLANGLLGGLISAGGSLVGGFLADKMNRRLAYAVAGGITGGSALAMAFAPMTPTTYLVGTLAYGFANGVAFAAFYGLVNEMVSHGAAVTTKYTLFVAVSNQAISYTTYLDGLGSKIGSLGARGVLMVDALLTAIGIGVLLAMVALDRGSRRKAPAPAVAS